MKVVATVAIIVLDISLSVSRASLVWARVDVCFFCVNPGLNGLRQARFLQPQKNRPEPVFGITRRKSGRFQSLDTGAQAALVASDLVLGKDAFVHHAVHDRLGYFES